MEWMDSCKTKSLPYVLLLVRLVAGLMFFFHGWQKLSGWMAGSMNNPLIITAGIIEALVGLLVVLGIFTTWAAILGALQGFAIFIVGHSPLGGGDVWSPLANRGELGLLYAMFFLLLATLGGGRFSFDALCCKGKKKKSKK